MKKQRWRRTKKKMKKWHCDNCMDPIKVLKDYQPKYCCDGWECGCYGLPIDPMLCDDCHAAYFGTNNLTSRKG